MVLTASQIDTVFDFEVKTEVICFALNVTHTENYYNATSHIIALGAINTGSAVQPPPAFCFCIKPPVRSVSWSYVQSAQ